MEGLSDMEIGSGPPYSLCVLTHIELRGFKAFAKFGVSFGKQSLLVGPNSAGKSTLISALRAGAAMLRHASQKPPEFVVDDRGRERWAYALEGDRYEIEEENLRHEFRPLEARVRLSFSGRVRLHMVWPEDEDAFFYLQRDDGWQPRRPVDARTAYPVMSVVPLLTPIEQREELLEPEYVRRHLRGRRASRHFRNQVYLLGESKLRGFKGRIDGFLEFCRKWAPELSVEAPYPRAGTRRTELDMFYKEGRTPKEIAWAGDGMQVWLQILLHLFLGSTAEVLVLDEPDVFLHADLQRRLLRALSSLECQTILATHSAEMLAEAPAQAVVWIDKSRPHGIRAPDAPLLGELSQTIGSHFNVRLARVLKARLALFVEGQDMVILRMLASQIGAKRIATEEGVAVVPLEGFSNWRRLEGFAWLSQELLMGTVRGFVLLDRDYHSEPSVQQLKRTLRSYGLEAYVWRRHELESYLVVPDAIARASGASLQFVTAALTAATNDLQHDIFAGFMASWQQDGAKGVALKTLAGSAHKEFESLWEDAKPIWALAPAKELLSGLNRRLQAAGFAPVNSRSLATSLKTVEIAGEFQDLVMRLEAIAAGED